MIEKKPNHTSKFAGVTCTAREHTPTQWSTKQGTWQTAGERQAALVANYYRGRRVTGRSPGSPSRSCSAARTLCSCAACSPGAAWTPAPRWPQRCTWSSRTARWASRTWPGHGGSSAASAGWSRDLGRQQERKAWFTCRESKLEAAQWQCLSPMNVCSSIKDLIL